MHRDGRDAEFLGGAQDAKGDLAAVGDEDLVEHRYSITSSGSPYSTGVPSSTKIAVTVPARGATISLKVFIASTSRTLSPGLDLGADLDERLGVRRGLAIGGADHGREHGAGMVAAALAVAAAGALDRRRGATTGAGAARAGGRMRHGPGR